MEVILYQTGELEAKAVLQRPKTGDIWIGVIDPPDDQVLRRMKLLYDALSQSTVA